MQSYQMNSSKEEAIFASTVLSPNNHAGSRGVQTLNTNSFPHLPSSSQLFTTTQLSTSPRLLKKHRHKMGSSVTFLRQSGLSSNGSKQMSSKNNPLWSSQQKFNFASKEGFLNHFFQTHNDSMQQKGEQKKVSDLLKKLNSPRCSFTTYNVEISKNNSQCHNYNSLDSNTDTQNQNRPRTVFEDYLIKKKISKEDEEDEDNTAVQRKANKFNRNQKSQRNTSINSITSPQKLYSSLPSTKKQELRLLMKEALSLIQKEVEEKQDERYEDEQKIESLFNSLTPLEQKILFNLKTKVPLTDNTHKRKFIPLDQFQRQSSSSSNQVSYKQRRTPSREDRMREYEKPTSNLRIEEIKKKGINSPRKKISLIELAQSTSSFDKEEEPSENPRLLFRKISPPKDIQDKPLNQPLPQQFSHFKQINYISRNLQSSPTSLNYISHGDEGTKLVAYFYYILFIREIGGCYLSYSLHWIKSERRRWQS